MPTALDWTNGHAIYGAFALNCFGSFLIAVVAGVRESSPPSAHCRCTLRLGRFAATSGLTRPTFSARVPHCAPEKYWKDPSSKEKRDALSLPFYGYNRPGAKISEGVRESFWLQSMMVGFPASYFCIKAFCETDLTEDLRKIDVRTLILHGDDEQIVPIGAAAMLSSKLVKNATLKVYKGAPHGMCTTLKDQVNADLLAFLKA